MPGGPRCAGHEQEGGRLASARAASGQVDAGSRRCPQLVHGGALLHRDHALHVHIPDRQSPLHLVHDHFPSVERGSIAAYLHLRGLHESLRKNLLWFLF
ncbi:unnamed protein product [Ixodes persulcatus]